MPSTRCPSSASAPTECCPTRVCLLPPLKSCDKGNTCLSCGHYATDATDLDELHRHLTATETLLAQRRQQFKERAGRELTDDNVWVNERLHDIVSLQAIITRLSYQADAQVDSGSGGAAVVGAVTTRQATPAADPHP